MRLRHPTGRIVHLSHEIAPAPATNLPAVIARLDSYSAVRAVLGADVLGVSLRLPPGLAAALAVDGRARTRLRAELDIRSLEVVTLSGTPVAEGGGEATDSGWDRPGQREYALDLARVLLDLLPEDSVRGVVNTVGLGPREGWDDAAGKASTGCSAVCRPAWPTWPGRTAGRSGSASGPCRATWWTAPSRPSPR